MSIDIPLVDDDVRSRLDRRCDVFRRCFVSLKRAIGREAEPASRLACLERTTVFPKHDILLQSRQCARHGGPGIFDVDLSALHGEALRSEEVEWRPDDEMRLVLINLDEGIHHGIERELVRMGCSRTEHEQDPPRGRERESTPLHHPRGLFEYASVSARVRAAGLARQNLTRLLTPGSARQT